MSKDKLLNDTLRNLEKKFGKGSVMIMGDEPTVQLDSISTGSLKIDEALGIGGVPKGRIIEIFGPESSGKTTLALHTLAEAQKQGGTAAFIDAEHALDANYAEKIGVKVNELILSQPDTGEEALEITEALVRSGVVDIVVVDSVAALVPKAEIEGEMGDSHVGLQARLMSQALRKLAGVVHKTNCTIVFINQLREKVGVMFGSPETTPGGRALKFYSSVRIDIRRRQQIKDGTDVVGNETKVKIVKNKVAPPFKEVDINIIYGEGIDVKGEIIDIGVEKDIIDKGGSWYTYEADNGETIKSQGILNFKAALSEIDGLYDEIKGKIYGDGDKDMENAEETPEDNIVVENNIE